MANSGRSPPSKIGFGQSSGGGGRGQKSSLVSGKLASGGVDYGKTTTVPSRGKQTTKFTKNKTAYDKTATQTTSKSKSTQKTESETKENKSVSVNILKSARRQTTQYETSVSGTKTATKVMSVMPDEDSTVSRPASPKKVDDKRGHDSYRDRMYKEMANAILDYRREAGKDSVIPRLIMILLTWFVMAASAITLIYHMTDLLDPIKQGFDLKLPEDYCYVQVSLKDNIEDCCKKI